MPNHMHGIIHIVGAGHCACPLIKNNKPNIDDLKKTSNNYALGQPQGVAPTNLSLSDITHRFKSYTTSKYINGIKEFNWPQFNHRIWQRNYYEHIIRTKKEYHQIRNYIASNPASWKQDKYYQ